MFDLYACITQDHNLAYVAVAAVICLSGSILTVMMMRRTLRTKGLRKRVQVMLAGFLSGATVWSTHFIAMLGYDPGLPHGYDLGLTLSSLVIAVVGLFMANLLFAYGRDTTVKMASGLAFGLTVSAMHYTGMAAYQVPGTILWNLTDVALSVGLGAVLGLAAFHRVLFPVTRLCWLGGALLMVLSICATHFLGMTAVQVELSPLAEVPPQTLSNTLLGALVTTIASLVLFLGFIALTIELHLERESVSQLEYAATHDTLTGLPNRYWLRRQLDQLQAAETAYAVLTMDLDNFKQINDLHGHEAGDEILRTAARRLDAACREGEHVARTGGDEFVGLMTRYCDLGAVEDFARRLHGALSDPIETETLSVETGGSVGIATSQDDDAAVVDIVQRSDLAMYRAKHTPDLPICRYDRAMDEEYRDRLALIDDLREAINRDEFHLVYQLQNDVATLAPTGCEVLLRWQHPTRGLISPGVFIPLAEETGLIRKIGLWVLRTACFEAASWQVPLSVAVNVAPQQLVARGFVEDLQAALHDSGLAPGRLELEVTEASVIDDHTMALRVMHQIKDLGVRIAMDDFGTGYSSLATLQAFPFDKIKIDRSFVSDLHSDDQKKAIVRAVLLLGRTLGIPILAEGVELQEELDALKSESCAAAQGFLFGKPLSLADIRKATGGSARDVA